MNNLSREERAGVRADAVAGVSAGERTIVVVTSIGVGDGSVWRWSVEAGVTFKGRVAAE